MHLYSERELLTPADVRGKVFATVRIREGYDMAQVDTFLDQVEATLSRVLQENAELKARPQAAGQDRVPAAQTAPHIIALAQEAADRAIAMAQIDARKIITEARGHADAAQREALGYGNRIREGLQGQIRQLRALLSDLEVATAQITDLQPPSREAAPKTVSSDTSPGTGASNGTTASGG